MKFKKIVIIGNACSGKTKLARWLSKWHEGACIHVDSLQFNPDLSRRPNSEVIQLLQEIESQDAWIIDGYGPLDIFQNRLKQADLIVMLDLPYFCHFVFALKRLLSLLLKPRAEMKGKSSELNWSHIRKLFQSIVKHQYLMRPELLRILSREPISKKVIYIKNPWRVVSALSNELDLDDIQK